MSSYIVSRHPLSTTSLFNALMNSYVAWSGSIPEWIALGKMYVKRCLYAFFFSFLVAINNLPAKSVPITRKGLPSLIMYDGEMPYCFSGNGLVWNLFHFKHFLIPFFAFCCSLWFWYDLDFFPDSSHFSLWLSIHGSPVSLIGDFHS